MSACLITARLDIGTEDSAQGDPEGALTVTDVSCTCMLNRIASQQIPPIFRECMSAVDHPVSDSVPEDFRGALVDFVEFGVTIKPLNWILSRIPVSAVHLYCLVRHLS
ncbi:MAG: hypothetical protein J07HR59_00087 [Halorubrum sp. J07HR59]|nr:MAG: hypothetical protein J07HR59_00087 [Halorubrum sp. J07HR59]